MRNLKEETLKKLKEYEKTVEDIKWIGCRSFKISPDLFWKLADTYYDAGYGTEEVAVDLIIVGEDWWMERESYDGAEWWKYKTMPIEPKTTKAVSTLFPSIYTNCESFYLKDLVIDL